MDVDSVLEEQFLAAANHLQSMVANHPEKANEADLLYLYGRYKLCTEGLCQTPKPGFLSFAARKKWTAWNCLSNLSRDKAMEEYVIKINQLDPNWSQNGRKITPSGMGVSVSTLNHCSRDEKDIIDTEKDLFDWCKEGSLSNISNNKPLTWPKDTEDRTLLHWACDRGYKDIVEYLIREGHDINCQDSDKSTPLHYASSCDRDDLVDLLLHQGADPSISDADGDTPQDCCSSSKIKELFDKYFKDKQKT
ncbi:acyl-CoA-binding domain-containing protein 6-like [Ciona intestinalis]